MGGVIGRYRVIEDLGRGGMGIVYRGVHDRLEREVAIKQLSPALTANPQFKERFFSEAKTQAQLQHPNIVTIYDLIEKDGDFFIVMEYFRGRGLDELVDEHAGRGMAPDRALEIFRQVLEALDCAHSLGVIHRDVKPSNVLIGEGGTVKLMDFGIALLVGDKRLTQSSQTIGTPIYMSPEQILRPRELDHRTDIYSAGVMLFEMLSGRPPFDAETEYEIKKFHLETPPAEAVAALGDVDSAVRQAIERALSKEPEDRFSSAREFLRAVTGDGVLATQQPTVPLEASGGKHREEARSADSGPSVISQPPPPDARAPELWRRPAVLAAAAAVAILLAVGLLFAFSGEEPEETRHAEAESNLADPVSQPLDPPGGDRGGGSGRSTSPAAEGRFSREGNAGPVGPEPNPPAEAAVEPAPPPVDPQAEARRRAAQEEEIQRRLVGEARRQVVDATVTARRLLADDNFEEARSTVLRALSRSAPYRAELVDEVVALQLLQQEITERVVDRQSEKEKQRLAQQAWELRVEEVEELIGEGKFPEARQLAVRLLQDDELPVDLATRVRELEERAQEELKQVWSKTEVEESTTVVNPRRKKKRGGGNTP